MRTNLDRSKEQAVREAFERAREEVSNDGALASITDSAVPTGSHGSGHAS